MTEQKLEITTNQVRDKTYKNIDLRILENNASITIEKKFLGLREVNVPARNGKEPYSFYSGQVNYDGEENVGMSLSNKEVADSFEACGGIGDKIRITLNKEMYVDKRGMDRVAKKFTFELVE